MADSESGLIEQSAAYFSQSVGKVAVVATVAIVGRLLAITGYDPGTALALSSGADFFSLIFTLVISAFPAVAALACGAALLVAAERIYRQVEVPSALSVLAAMLCILMLASAPLSVVPWISPGVGLLALLVSLGSRWGSVTARSGIYRLLYAVASITIMAVGIRALVINDEPFGYPQIYHVSVAQANVKLTGSVVGYGIGSSSEQRTILIYRPRQVLVIPTASVLSAQVCSLSGDRGGSGTAVEWAVSHLQGFAATGPPKGYVRPCFT